MDSTAEFAQLPLRLGDQLQWRYEVIRPLVLLGSVRDACDNSRQQWL